MAVNKTVHAFMAARAVEGLRLLPPVDEPLGLLLSSDSRSRVTLVVDVNPVAGAKDFRFALDTRGRGTETSR